MSLFPVIKSKLPEFISAIFIFLFIYTATNKLMSPMVFEHAMDKSPLLKPYASKLVYIIPVLEIAVAIALLFDKSRMIGLCASACLLTAFTVYVGYMLLFIPSLPCSCGGIIQKLSWTQHLLLNVFLTGLSLLAILLKTVWQTRPNLYVNGEVMG